MSGSPAGSSQPQSKGASPVVYILIGLFLYAAAAFMYFYFAHLEATGGSTSMHAAVALLYNLGGKWLVVSIAPLIGTLSLIGGIVGLRKSRS